ncbi:uncharacterized protein [Elaeis guineensis]|uniref:uncharacterized protein n=1 Tax=Elaeis guineensis var. tenera TaxID=51953 RepID=UPI003C6D454F
MVNCSIVIQRTQGQNTETASLHAREEVKVALLIGMAWEVQKHELIFLDEIPDETDLLSTTINDAYKKELREKACANLARWMNEAAIPFEAVKLDSFGVAVESIGRYGVGINLRLLMKFRLDRMVQKVGVENVVQVITNNASSYGLAGQLLEAKYPTLYWTPCAAHCVDLMLEDIGKLPSIARTIKKAIELTGYIYNHSSVFNMMRKYTSQRNLLRPTKTRFATSFLTLSSIHRQHDNLRKMFTSEEWSTSKWAKEQMGKKACQAVLSPSF